MNAAEIISPTRPKGWRFQDNYLDGEAFGVCAVSFYRDRDRRTWICVPHGDTANGCGVFPGVRAVCDDFGNLVRAEVLS